MSATNALENALLSLLFENTDTGLLIGDATGLRGSSTAGVMYVSLHTGNPGESGSQTSVEAAYTSYTRQSVARSTAGWTVASGTVSNDSAITFVAATGGSETESYFGLGSSASGSGNLYIWGALTSGLAVSSGIQPSFAAGALQVTLD